MENLYRILVEWKNIEAACKYILENLENKLSAVNDSRPPVDVNGEESSPSQILPDVSVSCF